MTFGTGGGILLLLATTLYLAISPDLYLRGIIRLLPVPRRRRAEDIAFQLCQTLRYWMLGQMVDMGVVGVLSMTGLALLGIPLPLALGVLAGLLTFVPYVGAILAGIPAVIVASTVGKLERIPFTLVHGIRSSFLFERATLSDQTSPFDWMLL
ncbi:AI-2E family transporter [Acidocella sp. MX-AZ03]|nr:AI-2E family transporter [Acidocella sp. MX-AZ03]WBO58909.1 AI-2E family transporter [Acidocella sp. MX-AZ03]